MDAFFVDDFVRDELARFAAVKPSPLGRGAADFVGCRDYSEVANSLPPAFPPAIKPFRTGFSLQTARLLPLANKY
jgi:hypothetical protein